LDICRKLWGHWVPTFVGMNGIVMEKININEKFSKFSEHWRPKTVAALNGQEFKLAKILGEYPFHAHEGEDEMFFCWRGSFVLDFESGESVHVGEGVKNNGDADVEAKYDAPMGEWV